MQWVAKRTLFTLATLLPLAIGAALFFAESTDNFAPTSSRSLYCFDSATATIRVTLDSSCPGELISLGDSRLTESATITGEVIEVHPILLARFEAARISAAADGVDLYITSGFRSFARQGELFRREVELRGSETEAAKWVLPPQYSHHPRGLALDINYPKDPAGARWLEIHGARFGLCRVYANEWWHFEGAIAPGQKCPAMAENALSDTPELGSIS